MSRREILKLQIRGTATRLRNTREEAEELERELQRRVGEFVAENEGGLRDWARKMQITPQYACDIRHGRRKISAEVLRRIEAL